MKGYKRARGAYTRGGRRYYPVIRNPQNVLAALQGNIKALYHPEVLKDAAGITVGSLGSPIVAAFMATTLSNVLKRDIPLTGPVGIAMKAVSGAVLSTGITAVTKNTRLGKNVIYGTVAGLIADLMKTQILPRIPFLAPKAGVSDYLPGMGDYLTVPPGMGDYLSVDTPMADYLPMNDYLSEEVAQSMQMSGMGAYASSNEFMDARDEDASMDEF